MLKKSLLSLAVTASLVGLSGCNISSTTDNAGAKPSSQAANEVAKEVLGVTPVFDPIQSKLPLGIDLIFAKAGTTDGTADTGRAGTRDESPVSNAIDRLDGGIGVSTPIDIPMSGSLDDEQSFAGKVFLIELANADVDPLITSLDVKDILGQGNAAVPASQPAFGTDYRVETISVNDGTDNVIRIVPLTPLKAKTKYLAVVTTGVVDADGNAIGVNKNYTDIVGDAPLVSPALGAVRDALQAWSGLANGFFNYAVNVANPQLLTAIPTISSISAHTTIATDSVLLGMALPNNAADTFLAGAVAKSVKEGVRENEALDQTDFEAVWTAIETTYAGQAETITALQGGVGSGTSIGGNAHSQPTSRTAKAVALTGALNGTGLPTSTFGLPKPGYVYQGNITLPYYLTAAAPAEAEQASTATLVAANAVQNTPWTADATIGATLKLGLTTGMTDAEKAAVVIPPKDVDGTTNVNGNFPFAAKTSDVKVPFIVHAPDADDDNVLDCGSKAVNDAVETNALCGVVVYVHGITGSRGHALPFAQGASNAAAVANAANKAVIAIDLPLHGIAPLTATGIADPFLGLSFDTGTYATAASVDTDFDGISERHFGYGTGADGVLTPLVYDDAATTEANEALAAAAYPNLKSNYSGAAFINLSNFMVTRDAMRQAVMDQLNLIASLGALDFDGHTGADFDVNDIHIVGHSLGGILTPVVVNIANSMAGAGSPIAAIQTMSLVTPGGQVARIIENSPSFAGLAATTSPVDNSGNVDSTFGVLGKLNVATDGAVVQGKADYESFLNVFQATLDGVDPIVYAGGAALAAQKTLVVEVVGDGGTQVIEGTVVNKPDQTVPNSADTGDTWEAANPSPLAGTEPLITELGITTFASTADPATAAASKVGVRLKKGTHTSILSPSAVGDADTVTEAAGFAEGTLEKETFDNTAAAQTAIIEAIVTFITGGGAGVSIDNAEDVVAAP